MPWRPRPDAEQSYTYTLSSSPALDWGEWPRHAPAALSRERTRYPFYRRFGEYRLGEYWCGKCRPRSGSNAGSSSPKRVAVTGALSRPRAKECRQLRTVSIFVEEGSHWTLTDGTSTPLPFQKKVLSSRRNHCTTMALTSTADIGLRP